MTYDHTHGRAEWRRCLAIGDPRYLDYVVKGGKVNIPFLGSADILGLRRARTLVDATIAGLPETSVNELLEFEGGKLGLALNLDETTIGAVVLGEPDARVAELGETH